MDSKTIDLTSFLNEVSSQTYNPKTTQTESSITNTPISSTATSPTSQTNSDHIIDITQQGRQLSERLKERLGSPKDNPPPTLPHPPNLYPTSRNLYVGNLSSRVSPEELSNLFSRHGRIEQCTIMEGKNYGFVNYMSIKSAARAKSMLEGYIIDGKPIHINYSKGVPTKILWVGNVRSSVTEDDLENLFSRYGRIERLDRKVSSNCAKIYFENLQDAIDAFEAMQGYHLDGWNFLINYGVPREVEHVGEVKIIEEERPKEKDVSRHLWVGNLNSNVTSDDLEELFKPYGDIETCKVFVGKGYGFIDFTKIHCAMNAMYQLNGVPLRGDRIVIKLAKKGESSRHIWVSNFSPTITEEKIKNEFSRYGKIEQIRYKRTCNTAFIDYYESQDAEKAKTLLQGKTFEGYPLKIDFGRPNGEKYSDCLYFVFPRNSRHIDTDGVVEQFRDFRVIGSEPGKYGCYLWFQSVLDAVHGRDTYNGKVLGNPDIVIEFSNEERRPEIYRRRSPRPRSPERKQRSPERRAPEHRPKRSPEPRKRSRSPPRKEPELKKVKQEDVWLSPVSPPSSPERANAPAWQGYIAKGGVKICRAKATSLGGGRTLREITPNGLPEIIDIKNRAPLNTLSSTIKVENSTLLCFTFDREQDKKPFLELLDYFKNRERAGIASCSDCEIYLIPGDNGLNLANGNNLMMGIIVKTNNPVVNLLNQFLKPKN